MLPKIGRKMFLDKLSNSIDQRLAPIIHASTFYSQYKETTPFNSEATNDIYQRQIM